MGLFACGQSQKSNPDSKPIQPAPLEQDNDEHDHAMQLERCSAMVKQVSTVTDENALLECLDFYNHNPDENTDYLNMIALEYRIISPEVNPHATDIYTHLAWILISKWIRWKFHPDEMPDGRIRDREAYHVLMDGRENNPEDADYHLDSALTMQVLSQYEPEYNQFVFEAFRKTDQYADTDALKVRARLSLGHAYRKSGHPQEALEAYNWTLALDPGNKIALREKEKLTGVQ